jgi:ABC-type multidrug transport system fused ATPase/permease subunit
MHADLETQLNSMERIEYYCAVPTESNAPSAKSAFVLVEKSKHWPNEGLVMIKNLNVRYREDLPLVLNKISATIRGGERVGICGRTGSGKSSFALALFRMIPIVSGEIHIDDVNILGVSLEQLRLESQKIYNSFRSSIAIVPQDPTLFHASIRYNLDPTEQFSDEKLWDALHIAQLSQVVSNLPNKLDYEVAEGYAFFS